MLKVSRHLGLSLSGKMSGLFVPTTRESGTSVTVPSASSLLSEANKPRTHMGGKVFDIVGGLRPP